MPSSEDCGVNWCEREVDPGRKQDGAALCYAHWGNIDDLQQAFRRVNSRSHKLPDVLAAAEAFDWPQVYKYLAGARPPSIKEWNELPKLKARSATLPLHQPPSYDEIDPYHPPLRAQTLHEEYEHEDYPPAYARHQASAQPKGHRQEDGPPRAPRREYPRTEHNSHMWSEPHSSRSGLRREKTSHRDDPDGSSSQSTSQHYDHSAHLHGYSIPSALRYMSEKYRPQNHAYEHQPYGQSSPRQEERGSSVKPPSDPPSSGHYDETYWAKPLTRRRSRKGKAEKLYRNAKGEPFRLEEQK